MREIIETGNQKDTHRANQDVEVDERVNEKIISR